MKPGVKKADPVANPDVLVGDHVYFRHPKGPHAAEVKAVGRHGITVDHAGKPTKVRWEHVLGHKTRKAQRYQVLEEGEDGVIVKDEAGKRKYLNVPPEARGEPMVLEKSFNGGSGRLVVFAKGGPIANRPGLHLQQETDKNGKVSRHWERTQQDLPKVGHAPAANDNAPAHGPHNMKPGDNVSFRNGAHEGTGKVHAVGQHGAVVHDLSGGEHRVRHEHITANHSADGTQPAVRGSQDPVHPKNFNAAEYAKQHDDPSVTADSIIDAGGAETRAKVEKAKARLTDVKQTIDEHGDGAGGWNEERAALHRKIMFDGVEVNGKKVPGLLHPDRVKAATPAPGVAPTFIALGGRGGSGKSSLAGKVYDEGNAIVLDADHIKGMIPEYAGWNAHAVHEESSHVLETVLTMSKLLGVNVVLDATMKTGKSIVDKVDDFKKAGFRTEAHYMHLPRQEAAKRAISRFERGGENGRFVPPEVVLGNTKNEENFDNIKKRVDAWSFHDNNVPKGQGPITISQHGTPQLVPKKIMTKSFAGGKIVLWRKK